jgi:hypothetical protein
MRIGAAALPEAHHGAAVHLLPGRLVRRCSGWRGPLPDLHLELPRDHQVSKLNSSGPAKLTGRPA